MRERSTDKNIKENIFILKVFTLWKSQIAQIQETAGIEKKKKYSKVTKAAVGLFRVENEQFPLALVTSARVILYQQQV